MINDDHFRNLRPPPQPQQKQLRVPPDLMAFAAEPFTGNRGYAYRVLTLCGQFPQIFTPLRSEQILLEPGSMCRGLTP